MGTVGRKKQLPAEPGPSLLHTHWASTTEKGALIPDLQRRKLLLIRRKGRALWPRTSRRIWEKRPLPCVPLAKRVYRCALSSRTVKEAPRWPGSDLEAYGPVRTINQCSWTELLQDAPPTGSWGEGVPWQEPNPTPLYLDSEKQACQRC